MHRLLDPAPTLLVAEAQVFCGLLPHHRRGHSRRSERAEMIAKIAEVFRNNRFLYGVRGRGNAGYGLPQLADASRETLNATNHAAARAAMMAYRGPGGRRLGIMPGLLVVPPSLESATRKLLNSELGTGGEPNEWKGTAELLVTPWLS